MEFDLHKLRQRDLDHVAVNQAGNFGRVRDPKLKKIPLPKELHGYRPIWIGDNLHLSPITDRSKRKLTDGLINKLSKLGFSGPLIARYIESGGNFSLGLATSVQKAFLILHGQSHGSWEEPLSKDRVQSLKALGLCDKESRVLASIMRKYLSI